MSSRDKQVESFSAGIEAKGLNKLAVKAMAEVGVDISGQTSKTVDQFQGTVSLFPFAFFVHSDSFVLLCCIQDL